jgi:D-glycero-D-manno-heptose 1,7-bisphosphate phosphatase
LRCRPAVFFDRDGVINVSPPRGEYITKVEQLTLFDNVFDWIRLFNELDFLVIVVTNQRCIATGIATSTDIDALHRHIAGECLARGCRIDDFFVCPHAADSCNCRKPKPGMVLAAVHKWNIDLPKSLVIGDSDLDRDLARNCDMRFVRAENGRLR